MWLQHQPPLPKLKRSIHGHPWNQESLWNQRCQRVWTARSWSRSNILAEVFLLDQRPCEIRKHLSKLCAESLLFCHPATTDDDKASLARHSVKTANLFAFCKQVPNRIQYLIKLQKTNWDAQCVVSHALSLIVDETSLASVLSPNVSQMYPLHWLVGGIIPTCETFARLPTWENIRKQPHGVPPHCLQISPTPSSCEP